MPAPFLMSSIGAATCRDCTGSLLVLDTDGSLTGRAGQLAPCLCVDASYGESEVCACHITSWPYRDGYTGWVLNETVSSNDAGVWYRPCVVHNVIVQRGAVPAAA